MGHRGRVAQHACRPRRFHLRYVEGRWEDNLHTLQGKAAHRRVDRIVQLLPETKEAEDAGKDAGGAIIHHADDQLLVIDIGPSGLDWTRRLHCLGKSWTPLVRASIV